MDHDLEALSRSPMFTWRRLWITLLASAAILAAASFLVRTFPNSGYQAGYDAANDKGQSWVQTEVDAASGTALPLCEELNGESESSPSEPRYEYESFIQGCGDAVSRLYGRPVPLLPPE